MDLADREEAVSERLPATAWPGSGCWLPPSPAPVPTWTGANGPPKRSASRPLEPGLEWVASTLAATGLLGEVKESTRRISDLVAAVKSYSQLDRAAMQETDVAEGLESTLVMLAHRIPAEVTVVRDYGPRVPRIEALAAELNQVWTNLIDNALYAMAGQRDAPRLDAGGPRCGGRGDRRHRRRDVARDAGARVRPLLHDQGRG